MMQDMLGQTGLAVPRLGFGAMQIGDARVSESDAADMLHLALDLGLTLIDTARSYGSSEERIGRHLSARRSEFVLSTKVGYGVAGVPDWTYDCVVRGVDDARRRLRTDVIDVVHLHSCGLDVLERGEVVAALAYCVDSGAVRVAAYSGDAAALQYAVATGVFHSVQASVNVCDQSNLPLLDEARRHGIGVIAKRPLAQRPWAPARVTADPPTLDYRRRFAALESGFEIGARSWDEVALRFAAHAREVDCCLVGGTNPRHLERNAQIVLEGALPESCVDALRAAFARVGGDWRGVV
jgi:aryl-alcohol dehydrogenase-like predicted oxidoreductase